MTPERWQQIQSIFNDALTVAVGERDGFLEQACGGDAELRAEVVAMLDADDHPASVFDKAPAGLAEVDESFPPVGPYRLIRELGRGGMGAVYLGERADGTFDRQVAVKLIKRGMDTDEILARFRTERQILAVLDHPHIARLLDGGATEPSETDPGGRPFIVMEFVDGLPIDEYCRENAASLDQKLDLFDTVCGAVQYAHQNLVVHRDLKPSNILVTEDAAGNAQVKLLDFGIAKLLAEDADLTVPVTRTGVRIMTPEYAAPEQTEGGAITTSTDVFALGVVLHELLTGERPNRSAATRTTTKGELDLIVQKALREEPARRYASAEAMLADIRRFRSGLPVSARPDTLGYRTRKFVGRHRLGVAVASAFLILLLGSAIVTSIQQAATARERDRAEQERDKAEEVSAFLEDLFNASDPFLATTDRIDTLRIRDFLDRGAAKVRGELQQEPVLQAEMLDVIGNVYLNLGLFETAEPLIQQALEQRRALYGSGHPEVAKSLYSLARTYQSKSRYDAAEEHFRQAVDICRTHEDVCETDLSRALMGLGSVLRDQNEFAEAEQFLLEAISVQREMPDSDQLDLAASLLELGRVHQDRGNLAPAESLYRDVLSIHRQLLGENHPEVASSLDNLAVVLRQAADLDAAEPLTREALEIRERALGPEHPLTITSMYELASVLRDKGEFEPALALFGRVYELDRQVLGAQHHYVGLDLREIALTYLRMEQYDDAVRSYRASLDILTKALPPDHSDIIETRSGIGLAYMKKGELTRAESILRDVLQRRIRTQGEDSWWTGITKSLLGECVMRQGRFAEAEPLLVDGYDTLRDASGPLETALKRLVEFYETTNRQQKVQEYEALLAALAG